MFDNVVVGVDGYSGGRDALELAETLGSDSGRITLVHVEVLQGKPPPDADTGLDAERQRFGLERLERLRDRAGISADVARTRAPSTRRGLHEFAVGRAADLIVIGASGRNQVARSVLGDEVREILEEPPCAVAVAPSGYANGPAPLRSIGVAYDGSSESGQALDLARTFAAERSARLSAFQAVLAPGHARGPRNVEEAIGDEAERTGHETAGPENVAAQTEFSDNPVESLRKFGATVDLLILGPHRRRPLDDRIHPSKAQRLAEAPASPLLVLSPAPGESPRPQLRTRPAGTGRIAVGIAAGDRAEARDATCLAMMIVGSTGAQVTLVTVDTAPPAAITPSRAERARRRRATNLLCELRDLMAPSARVIVQTDRSVAQGLVGVARREQHDLLVIGSSPRAPHARVRIGRHTRQLLRDSPCAVAVAARGLGADQPRPLATIGVGYDGQPGALEALRVAGTLARSAGALLRLRAVADDRLLSTGWTPLAGPDPAEIRAEVIEPRLESLREDVERAASTINAEVAVDVRRGSPPVELIALSTDVDLLVIGSGRWGTAARVLLGGTGEDLMHDACCSVMVVPRPPSSSAALRSDAEAAPDAARAAPWPG